MVGRTKQFLSHVVPGVLKPMRILWNEVIGFLFLCLGIIPLVQGYRAFREFEAGREGPGRLLTILVFSVIMLYFGISSFVRARRIGRT
jgi:hypothetical protein